ncbi:hypothetical protein EAS64_10645 [Trebonia kvetii]|uniref:Uncharacterized protein n=1 Tax=Trebonia kvetii TaxID=2480626 RepID=A0A6P2C0X6_9ACTN|nr:hypothetical protein [Trebonia kvetii]TVZ05069.1 hypothetical protein EAS64_10645 [Trebonia kvetii]
MTITTDPEADAELARRSVRVRLPAWLAGSNPLDFGRMCRWRMEAADLAAGTWDVRLDERVRRRPARLVEVTRLAGSRNAAAAGAYSRLRRLPPSPSLYGRVPGDRVQAELDRISSQRHGDLAALMYQVTLATLAAPHDQLPGVVRQALQVHLLPLLPEAAAYLVEVDDALAKRYGAARVLRQMEDDSAMSCSRRSWPTSPFSGRRAGSSATRASAWAPISRRFSFRCPRGSGQCPGSGPAAWSSTRSAAR